MNRYLVFVLAPLIAAGVIGSVSGAQPRSLTTLDERLAGYPDVTVRLTDERIEAPAIVDAGMTLLVQENMSEYPGHSFVMRIPDDVAEDVVSEALGDASLVEVTPEWFWRSEFVGNGDRARPDRPAVALVDLKPGRYIVGDPFRAPSEFAQFEVLEVASSAGDQQTSELPKPDVTAELFEMGFNVPESISAGPQLWEVKNTGAMLHEIAIFPVPTGATPEDVMAAATAELEAEMSGDITTARPTIDAVGGEWVGWTGNLVAGVGVISPQRISLAQIDLEPGAYGAVCYLPVPDTEQAHLMLGMTDVFTVEAPGS